jgi:hypothetical protein
MPYVVSSEITQTLLALSVAVRNFAGAGPCTASLPVPRKKVFQPFSDSGGLVADG